MRLNQEAEAILNSIQYVTVATVDADGTPWNTPVAAYHFDSDYVLYWASWQGNQHSKNIRANGRAFVVVYDSTPFDNQPHAGVYMQGVASELTQEDDVMKAALVFGDDAYNPSDGMQYLGDHPRRIYKFVPAKVWINSGGDINGEFIDIRKEEG